MFIMCCGLKKKDMQVDNQSTSKLYSMHNTGVLIKRNFLWHLDDSISMNKVKKVNT